MGEQIEGAFSSVTSILFGKALQKIDDYGDWLLKNRRKIRTVKSTISGKEELIPPLEFHHAIDRVYVTNEEAFKLGETKAKKEDIEKTTIQNADKTLKNILYYSPDVQMGKNQEMEFCAHYIDCQFCYKSVSMGHVKYAAYSFWPRDSEYMFGVDTVFSSKFCIKCYNSVNLTRCFETSHSSHCSDCYFCHNCDGCSECMFCTNAKSLRYAIFNKQYPKEEYLKLKKKIQEEIFAKLEKDKKLDLNIFNLGCYKK